MDTIIRQSVKTFSFKEKNQAISMGTKSKIKRKLKRWNNVTNAQISLIDSAMTLVWATEDIRQLG